MSQEWMIDVLTDLRAFALKNGLMALAEQLDDTILVAAAELAPLERMRGVAHRDADKTGNLHRAYASSDNA
jgi:hypothetical protein